MQGNRSRDTAPEVAVRKLLHAAGYRFRVDARPVEGLRRTADILFTRRRIAVFIDGCFWHGCPIHYSVPRTNTAYWSPKIARNIERDSETTSRLAEAGWTVMRFWSHEPSQDIAVAVEAEIRSWAP